MFFQAVIVDDEQTVVRGLVNGIEWEEYGIHIGLATTDARKALQYITCNPVDLLITDVCMPGLDGLTLIQKGKNQRAGLRSIVISAYDRFEYVKDALKLGAENYLLKPVDLDELKDTLIKTVENMESHVALAAWDGFTSAAFRNNILDRWVHNQIHEDELVERAELLGIDVNRPGWCCLLVSLTPSPVDSSLMLQMIGMLKEHLGNSEANHFYVNHDMRIVGILNEISPQDASVRKKLNIILDELRRVAHDNGMDLAAVFGQTVYRFSDVHRSYNMALRYLLAAKFKGTVLYCDDYIQLENKLREKELDMKSEHGRREALAKVDVRSMLEDKNEFPDKQTAALVAALYLLEKENIRIESDMHPGWHRILCAWPQLKEEQCDQWIKDFVDFIEQEKIRQQQLMHPYVRKMQDEIHRNFAQDLSLKQMAEQYGVSSAYLGQLFRTQTGHYFNDYLMYIRLQAAERKLRQTTQSIRDIAYEVGFSSQTYFNRLFKRVYGFSPGEFRSVNRKT